jgi:Na+/H+ antiporter NhaD/arsenite permease-like protein
MMSMKKRAVMILAASTSEHILPAWWMLLPFFLQLLAIALMPFLALHWWERHYPKVAIVLGGITVLYYLFILGDRVHPLAALHEYISFIVLMGSLFVVASGIHIRVKEGATPLFNTGFLILGALLANLIGTTGASMLLIRPWIRMNKNRIEGFHTVFFIFLISNIGGCLTPIGDPPLFLGFLKGVPFFWTLEHLWKPWLVLILLLAATFYLLDRRNDSKVGSAPASLGESVTWSLEGLGNIIPLVAILGAIFIPTPWREMLMVGAALLSWKFTPEAVHQKNEFSAAPIKEVAWLFIGIFATMMPALDYLQHHAKALAETFGMGSHHFYYFTGILSSLLDNAPTYLSFLSLELGLRGGSVDYPHDVLRVALETPEHLIAISLGAVFFGAMTYIGNGPNFMVKSIVTASGIKTPSFFGYLLRYSLPFLLPLLVLVGWLFLH